MHQTSPLISVQKAAELILEQASFCHTETIETALALGRILAQNIQAPRDLPPFNRVAMDGIAIQLNEQTNLNTPFLIQGIQSAGEKEFKLLNENYCIEVMTGAVCPQNSNCIIPYEEVEIKDSYATIKNSSQIKHNQNIHIKGSDIAQNTTILKQGQQLESPHINALFAIGLKKISVFKPLNIGLIATGTELVQPGRPAKHFQIYNSNILSAQTVLTQAKLAKTKTYLIHDSQQKIEKTLTQCLQTHDHLIISGGVSKGKFDFIPQVLAALDVHNIIYKIKQQPGKPLWFGSTHKQQTVFALPGNPLSFLICLYRYVLPFIYKSLNRLPQTTNRICSSRESVIFSNLPLSICPALHL